MPLVLLVLTLLLTLHVPQLSAVQPSQRAIDEARRLRDNQAFAEAAKVLEGHLQHSPGDLEAARLHAQTLHWLKEYDRARTAYAAALARHPGDQGLRVDYARMLLETGDLRGARRLLEVGNLASTTSAEADGLLATALYWEGDLTRARNLFIQALEKDPSHQVAAQYLREIETLSASWLRLAPDIGVTVRGRIERSPYLYTLASLDTPVTTSTVAGVLQWPHPRGWLAEGAVERQRFPDSNQAPR